MHRFLWAGLLASAVVIGLLGMQIRPGVAQGTTIIYDFSQDDGTWWTGETDNGRAWIDNGALYVLNHTEAPYYEYTTTGDLYTDFTLDVESWLAGGTDDNWHYIVVRDSKTGRHKLGFSADGYILASSYINDEEIEHLPIQHSSAIYMGEGPVNHVHIQAEGPVVRFYVNDVLVVTINEPRLPGGRIQLGAAAMDAEYSTVAFDNVVITDLAASSGQRSPGGAGSGEPKEVSARCVEIGNPPEAITSDDPVIVTWSLTDKTRESLALQLQHVMFEVSLDGQPLQYTTPGIDTAQRYEYTYEGNTRVFWFVDWSVPVGTLAAGQHETTIRTTWDIAMVDGYGEEIGPGTANTARTGHCVFAVEAGNQNPVHPPAQSGQTQESALPIPRQITFDGAKALDPEWSPDGQRIVFYSDIDGDRELFVMNADGSNRQQLTNNTSQEYFPTWSPDGSQIAFVSDEAGEWELVVMSASGGNTRTLSLPGSEEWYPQWSLDGTRLIFSSDRDGALELYTMALSDTYDLQRLTFSADVWDYVQDIAPDSGDILFASYEEDNADYYVMDNTGGNLRQLTTDGIDKGNAAWSPDGTMIAFTATTPDELDLFVLDLFTGAVTQLTDTPYGEWYPDWSPDGSQIMYAAGSRESDRGELFVIDVPAHLRSESTLAAADNPALDAVIQEALHPMRATVDAPETAMMGNDQQAVLDEFGPPDAFTHMAIPDSTGALMRYDAWSYFDAYTTFIFLDGVFQRSEFVERPDSAAPTPYHPAHFVLGMPLQGVQAIFPDTVWTPLTDMAGFLADYGASADVWAADRLVLAFVDDQLVFVQAMASVSEEGIE
jgi:Tol biopolymer transport system component